MATTLGSKAVGSVVKIKENGTPVEFYVAKHDYESGLNGRGRTLVVRKDCYDLRQWHTLNANTYASSAIDNWLNSTYKNMFDADIRGAIGTTRFYHTSNGSIVIPLTRSVFLLSFTELGRRHNYANIEGSALPIASTLENVQLDGRSVTQWTRTPNNLTSGDAWRLLANGDNDRENCDVASGCRPVFCLPSTALLDSSGLVTVNRPPAITSPTPSGSNLGTKEEGFDFSYTVTDVDGDAVTVKEYLDNTVKRSYQASLGQENTFEAVTAAHWQTVLNGSHTLKVAANDGKADSAPYTATFSKAVYSASITMTEPLPADALISVAVLSLTGSIPEDAALQVQLTNNGKDPQPVWEDATSSVKNGSNHVFANQAAANGFAFNFKVTVSRGPSGQGGHISKIGGAFQ